MVHPLVHVLYICTFSSCIPPPHLNMHPTTRAAPTPANMRNPTTMVRRRRLVRTRRRRDDGIPTPTAHAPQGTTTILGVVLAGDTCPLPHGWQQPGRQLLLRPYVSDMAASMHGWSGGSSGRRGVVQLDQVEESTTCLLGCWPRGVLGDVLGDGVW